MATTRSYTRFCGRTGPAASAQASSASRLDATPSSWLWNEVRNKRAHTHTPTITPTLTHTDAIRHQGASKVIVQLLKRIKTLDVDACDGRGDPLLKIAAMGGHAEVVTTLMEHGASPSQADRQGLTPIHFAAAMGHGDCVRLFEDDGFL